MRWCFLSALVSAVLAMLFANGSAAAQGGGSTPPSPRPAPAPCSAADQSAGKCSATPSPGQQFPYPGDQPGDHAGADPDDPLPAGAPSADPPGTPEAGATKTPDAPAASGGKQFPYLGDVDPAAASSPSNASSSSLSSSSSSAADPDDPLDTPAAAANATPGRRKLPKVKKLQNDEDREAEDVKVAKFYRDDGNNLAAYNRLRDATKLITDDADAWYLLGDVAQKLHKPDEANDAYRKFLTLEPNTRRAKALSQSQLNAKR